LVGDGTADDYAPNGFGGTNSILDLTDETVDREPAEPAGYGRPER